MKNWKYMYGMGWAIVIILACIAATNGIGKAFAISYNNSSVFAIPNILDSSGNTVAISVIDNDNGGFSNACNPYYIKDIDNIIYSKTQTWFKFSNTGSYDKTDIQFIFGNGPFDTKGYLVHYLSGTEVYSVAQAQDNGGIFTGSFLIENTDTSSGLSPNDFVISLVSNFKMRYNSTLGLDDGLYLDSINYYIFSSTGGYLFRGRYDLGSYNSGLGMRLNNIEISNFSVGYTPYNGHMWEYNPVDGYTSNIPTWIYNFNPTGLPYGNPCSSPFYEYFTDGILTDTGGLHEKSDILLGYYSDFTNEYHSGNLVGYSAIDFYGAGGIIDYGSGGTSTGETTDYFADCTSFIYVGCYIKGIYNAFIGWTNSIFPTLSFSGETDTCFSGSTSSGTYMQKLANLIAVVNPIPPGSGSVICTMFIGSDLGKMESIGGTGQVLYHRYIPEENIFAIAVPGLVPILEQSTIVFAGQTIIDIMIIVMLVAAIIYQKK